MELDFINVPAEHLVGRELLIVLKSVPEERIVPCCYTKGF